MTTYSGRKGASWAAQAFESKTAKFGGVIRRSARAAVKAGGLHNLIRLAHSNKFRTIYNGGQIIIFCNSDPYIEITPLHTAKDIHDICRI